MLLLLDNYDSFVHNLGRCLRLAGARTEIVRSDQINVDAVLSSGYRGVVIGPGPGAPDDAGHSLELVRELHDRLPMLGVCLGMQVIGQAFGAAVTRASEPLHGRVCGVEHDGRGLYQGLPSPLRVCRYHSLVLDRRHLPGELVVTATDPAGEVMGVRHASFPIAGVQFHPEAILTEHGHRMLENWLESVA